MKIRKRSITVKLLAPIITLAIFGAGTAHANSKQSTPPPVHNRSGCGTIGAPCTSDNDCCAADSCKGNKCCLFERDSTWYCGDGKQTYTQ